MDQATKEGAIEGLINMVMYIYQSHLEEGQSIDSAKDNTLKIINDLGMRYASEAGLEFKGYANPATLLDDSIMMIRTERRKNPALSYPLSNLITLRSMLKKKGDK